MTKIVCSKVEKLEKREEESRVIQIRLDSLVFGFFFFL